MSALLGSLLDAGLYSSLAITNTQSLRLIPEHLSLSLASKIGVTDLNLDNGCGIQGVKKLIKEMDNCGVFVHKACDHQGTDVTAS